MIEQKKRESKLELTSLQFTLLSFASVRCISLPHYFTSPYIRPLPHLNSLIRTLFQFTKLYIIYFEPPTFAAAYEKSNQHSSWSEGALCGAHAGDAPPDTEGGAIRNL